MDKSQLVEDIMKSLEDKQYSKEELGEVVKKAVTSMAAVANNGPESEDVLNGESKPSIQEASTPSEQKQDAAAQDNDTQTEEATQEATQTEEVKQEAAPEIPEPLDVSKNTQGGTTEPVFDPSLFSKEFSTGATLKQGPVGNVMANMKASPFDYVKQHETSTKNVQMTDADFKGEEK